MHARARARTHTVSLSLSLSHTSHTHTHTNKAYSIYSTLSNTNISNVKNKLRCAASVSVVVKPGHDSFQLGLTHWAIGDPSLLTQIDTTIWDKACAADNSH